MPSFERGGVTLFYEEWGQPEAPAVVLLHSTNGDLRTWHACAGAFAADYRVVAPDLRGHGLSDAPDDPSAYTIEGYAADLAALLDQTGDDLAAITGFGFGGMVALEFAVRWPERVAALVVCDSSPGPASDPPSNDAVAAGSTDRETLAARRGADALGKVLAAGVRDPFLAAGLRERYRHQQTGGIAGAAHARRTRRDLVTEAGTALTMPLLICCGERGAWRAGSEALAAALPGARIVLFRNCDEGVPAQRPEAFRDVVLAFLRDVEDGKSVAGERTV